MAPLTRKRVAPLECKLTYLLLSTSLVFLFSCVTPLEDEKGKHRNELDSLFESSQWGKVNLSLSQNSVNRQLEVLLGENENFEPLQEYPENSNLRKLSKPIGRLDIQYESGKFGTCTATLISNTEILTNYHCIPGVSTDTGPVIEAQLLMGYYSRDESSVVWYEVNVVPKESDKKIDFPILSVDGEPGLKWGMAEIGSSLPTAGDSLLLIHHPAGKAKHVTRGKCRVNTPNYIEEADLLHRCDTLPGSSGAPIFLDDSRKIVALHYAGESYNGSGVVNLGKLITEIEKKSAIVKSISGVSSNAESAYLNVDLRNEKNSLYVRLYSSEKNFDFSHVYLNIDSNRNTGYVSRNGGDLMLEGDYLYIYDKSACEPVNTDWCWSDKARVKVQRSIQNDGEHRHIELWKLPHNISSGCASSVEAVVDMTFPAGSDFEFDRIKNVNPVEIDACI